MRVQPQAVQSRKLSRKIGWRALTRRLYAVVCHSAIVLTVSCSRDSDVERLLPVRADAGAIIEAHQRAVRDQVRREVSAIDQRVNRVVPRPAPAQVLAFATGMLARLGNDEVVLHDTVTGRVLKRLEVESPQRVVVAADGSVLVDGLRRLYRARSDAAAPDTFAPVPTFPDSILFGDRRAPSRLWLTQPQANDVFRFDLDELVQGRPRIHTFSSPRCSIAPNLLRDGSFVCAEGDGLMTWHAGARARKLRFRQPASVQRIVPAARLDAVWILDRSGALFQMVLYDRAPFVHSVAADGTVVDLMSSGAHLAALRVSEPDATSTRRWSVEVRNARGELRWSRQLPEPKVDPEQREVVPVLLGNRNVAISDSEALIAVGGPESGCVWQFERDEPRFCW